MKLTSGYEQIVQGFIAHASSAKQCSCQEMVCSDFCEASGRAAWRIRVTYWLSSSSCTLTLLYILFRKFFIVKFSVARFDDGSPTFHLERWAIWLELVRLFYLFFFHSLKRFSMTARSLILDAWIQKNACVLWAVFASAVIQSILREIIPAEEVLKTAGVFCLQIVGLSNSLICSRQRGRHSLETRLRDAGCTVSGGTSGPDCCLFKLTPH